jgi:hypothetical protein
MPAVVAVMAALALGLWWLRKKGARGWLTARTGRAARRMESMERLALAPHHTLHLVRLDDRTILVAQSPAGLALIEGAALSAPQVLRAAAEGR